MKKLILISLLIGALPLSMVAQDDDLYFVPKKKSAVEKVTDKNGLPRDTYYSGSNRSVDDYNRRVSTYVPIDSASSDIIDFDGALGVYPDSLEDFSLTKKMERFDDYSLSENEAYWAGYQQARSDMLWHTPWYYRTYGLYNYWCDPWYYGYSWYYPYYYTTWHYGWWDPWYDYLYYGYYWGYPNYAYNYHYWGGGARNLRTYNDHAGTINVRSGNMNGRIYSTSANGTRNNNSSRLGVQRTTNLRNRTVGGQTTYNRTTTNNSRTVSNNNTPTNNTPTYSTPSRSSSVGGGGFSGGGAARSSGGGGGFSGGGGGARSAGGHAGSRR